MPCQSNVFHTWNKCSKNEVHTQQNDQSNDREKHGYQWYDAQKAMPLCYSVVFAFSIGLISNGEYNTMRVSVHSLCLK